GAAADLPRPGSPGAGAMPRSVGLSVEADRHRRGRRSHRARRRLVGRGGDGRQGPGGCLQPVPGPAPAGPAARADPPARLGRAAGRPRAAGRSLRRLLPGTLPSARARGPAQAPLLEDGHRHPARAGGVRLARAQPRDLPGGHRRAAARPHLHGVRAVEVPRHQPWQGVHARDLAVAGLGLRVLRGRPHRRRPHPATAGQARRGARQPDPDRAIGRVPLRSAALVAV
ncbi:MAG: GlnR-family transcriptional regulator, partial [uncultured Acidimicrobiales bacterium]